MAGLRPGEKYVFAVAAYTAEGRLIGGSIGDSTKHILASHPLPILLTWAYLAQVSDWLGILSSNILNSFYRKYKNMFSFDIIS